MEGKLGDPGKKWGWTESRAVEVARRGSCVLVPDSL